MLDHSGLARCRALAFGHTHSLGTDTQFVAAAGRNADVHVDFRSVSELRQLGLVVARQFHLHKVHRRTADESGDETGGGIGVDLHRRPDLLDTTVVEHNDPVGQRMRQRRRAAPRSAEI